MAVRKRVISTEEKLIRMAAINKAVREAPLRVERSQGERLAIAKSYVKSMSVDKVNPYAPVFKNI